jgi:hypothetical protein
MRVESSVTSLSWIPQGAVEGFNRLSFGLRVAHFDPPEVLGDLDDLQAHDRFRFANRLQAWIEVQHGRIVDAGQRGGGRINVTKVGYGPASIAFTPIALPELRPDPEVGPGWARFIQTAGGHTGFPTPRRVRHEPYIQIAGPVSWTTLALTIHADGTAEPRLTGASSFPRHWVYDHTGRLVAKSGFIDYDSWWREAFGAHTPTPGQGSAASRRAGPWSSRASRATSCSCCSTGCCGSRSTASQWLRLALGRSWSSWRCCRRPADGDAAGGDPLSGRGGA